MERTSTSITQPGAKLIAINSSNLFIKGNYQDFQRFPEVDIDIAADAEETLPSLTEAVKRLLNDDRKRAAQDRGARLAKAHQHALEGARDAAAFAWDASPISTARLSRRIVGANSE